ncbi:capsule-associated protein CAP1 [Podochytrium sp. JEL0797]|nr:capsule-associated protein CAP1 [Podochytrium sp. JEL0797]
MARLITPRWALFWILLLLFILALSTTNLFLNYPASAGSAVQMVPMKTSQPHDFNGPRYTHWKQFATDNECSTDTFDYLQIWRDLDPWIRRNQTSIASAFDSLDHTKDKVILYVTPTLRFSKLERNQIVSFTNGSFSGEPVEITSLLGAVAPLLVQSNIRDFQFIINGFDEPRLIPSDVPHSQTEYRDVADVFEQSQCFRDRFDTVKGDAKPLRSVHGFFMKPNSFSALNLNVPIFSQAKSACHLDLVIPLKYHVEVALDGVDDRVPWERKRNVLFWRGANTGGSYRVGSPWKEFHRTRLVQWAKEYELKHPGSSFDASRKMEWPMVDDDSLKVDIGFYTIAQFDEEARSELRSLYDLKGKVSFENTREFKYLLVVDGNSWPSRLQAYLQTNSVVLYAGVFTDFYNSALVPFVHYVPVKMDFSDLEQKMDWLMKNDDEARRINENAKRFMQRWKGMKQLQCYTSLLLLEYSSLFE